MEQCLILLIATALLLVAPSVQATARLSFANNTEVNITRTGCGATKLCLESPKNCDPAGNSTCLFTSVLAGNTVAPNGTMLSFELSGKSSGYIAVGLTVSASQGTTELFVCAQNSSSNGTFFFRTMMINNTNNMLSPAQKTVTEIRGKVNGSLIQCEFDVPNVNATRNRNSDSTTFSILLGSGTFDGINLGPFNVTLNSGPINIANPSAGVTTITPMTVSVTMTTMGASSALHPHAVTLLLSILTLSVLKTA